MGLASDLKIIYHMAVHPIRGGSHKERLESFYSGQASGYDDFRKRLLKGRETLYRSIVVPTNGVWAMVGAAQLGAFVGIPMLAYVGMMPDYSRYVGTCGRLPDTADPGGVMVALDINAAGTPAVEVFDPLCPACRQR